MADQMDATRAELMGLVDAAADLAALDAVRVAALGKKGRVTQLMQSLKDIAPEARREAGQALNRLKDEIEAAIVRRKETLGEAALDSRLKAETLDLTLPARPGGLGRLHPISQTMVELVQIFGAMGGSDDAPIHRAFATARMLRIADGPDEVHLRQIFRQEPAARWSVAESPYITRPED